MKTVIEMAREAGIDWNDHLDDDKTNRLDHFAKLVRADERAKYKWNSLGPGEMELSLRRNHKDELFECRRRFSAEEVMHGPDFMVEATAMNLEAEMDRAIRARSKT